MPELGIKGAGLPPRVRKKKPVVSAEQQMLKLAQGIFEEADVDKSGEVEASEMAGLVECFFAGCNKKIPHDILSNMESWTKETMERFDK